MSVKNIDLEAIEVDQLNEFIEHQNNETDSIS